MRLGLLLCCLGFFGTLAADYYGIDTYAKVKGGVVFPIRNTTVRGDSTTVLYGPTEIGVSLFQLTDVVWKNTYQTGYEISVALGVSPYSLCECSQGRWRAETEFLYQNFTRKITGSYNWHEIDTDTMEIYAQNYGNPIKHVSNKTHVYGLLSNMIYDYQNCSPFSFSVGGGAGVAWLQSRSTTTHNILHVVTTNPPLNETSSTIEKSPRLYGTAFAWQVLVDVNYNCLANLSVGVGYRLFGTTRFQGSSSSITANPGTDAQSLFKIPQKDIKGLLSNSVNVTLSYCF